MTYHDFIVGMVCVTAVLIFGPAMWGVIRGD